MRLDFWENQKHISRILAKTHNKYIKDICSRIIQQTVSCITKCYINYLDV